MEHYFVAAHVPEAEKFALSTMYLAGDTKLWWPLRLDDDAAANCATIATWKMLKNEFRKQFLPCNTGWLSREALKKLLHTGSVREYVTKFNSLMVEIRNMSEEDKLFNFQTVL